MDVLVDLHKRLCAIEAISDSQFMVQEDCSYGIDPPAHTNILRVGAPSAAPHDEVPLEEASSTDGSAPRETSDETSFFDEQGAAAPREEASSTDGSAPRETSDETSFFDRATDQIS
eukprot:3571935-Rhodomonas_salina.2